jgi:hypothetical protein
MRLPVAGGGYFRIYPYALTRAGWAPSTAPASRSSSTCIPGKWIPASRA